MWPQSIKSEVIVLLSAFFLFSNLFCGIGGISIESIFRFLNCHLGGEAHGDTMDWIGDSDKIYHTVNRLRSFLSSTHSGNSGHWDHSDHSGHYEG